MRCLSIRAGVICYADVLGETVTDRNGRVWRFNFDRYSGPLIVTKRGNPAAQQPDERSAFWPAFEAWLDAREGRPPRCTVCRGDGLVPPHPGTRPAIARRCSACNGSGRRPTKQAATTSSPPPPEPRDA